MVRWRKMSTDTDYVVDKRGAGPSRGRRRNQAGGLGGGGGGLGGLGGLAKGAGGGTMMLILVGFLLLQMCTGGGSGLDIGSGLQGAGAPSPDFDAMEEVDATKDEDEEFMEAILDDLNGYWEEVFVENDITYEPVFMTLFEGGVSSNCGGATSAIGPHYCPLVDQGSGNRFMYIDLSFFEQMESEMGAPGDFARAYVIAHEAGHHVQTLLGTSDEVRQRSAANSGEANGLSVRQELQADCYAGAWANALVDQDILDPGDADEALGAAAAVGDDRLLEAAGREVDTESFTHGSSAQRIRWFTIGMESGSPGDCDTFGVSDSEVGL